MHVSVGIIALWNCEWLHISVIILKPHVCFWCSPTRRWITFGAGLTHLVVVCMGLQSKQPPILFLQNYFDEGWLDAGEISMDRNTKATLSTYNTCVERSRLQRICSLPRCCVASVTAICYDCADVRNQLNIKACLLAEGMGTTLQSQSGFRFRGVQS